ncbi:hypothetical protein O1D97_00965 [Marinomonas sp. 15G1-11]|uniref:Uncharacterized protein n=1 Tax=Marinomonas phaeophyticola TaxID=3004091 RepID=A0ABT4JPF3_9GAMM|nr:hypothetical protein [Marinomonas sp. 15G1-11]MCZ2720247.1 hypothetical protein [Marinomonas sp. 15G1-11]
MRNISKLQALLSTGKVIDIHNTNTYSADITGYTTAICTLGVVEPVLKMGYLQKARLS